MPTQVFASLARAFSSTTAEFLAFLRQPSFSDFPELTLREKARAGAGLFILSLAITMAFGLLALPVVLLTDLTAGEPINAAFRGTTFSVIVSVLLLGPLIEEIIFRGWLSGTMRSILASALSLIVIYGGSELIGTHLADGSTVKALVLFAGAIVVLIAFSPLDGSRHIGGFDRLFPIVFYAQAIAFGALHFQNYAASSSIIALLATFPLIGCGLLWGYARIRLGLASAVILHAAYNIPAVAGILIMANSSS